jgi:hypothetical protein
LVGQETCHSSTLTILNHTSQFSAIIAKNQAILNFGNDCAQLCVAVAEHDTQAISLSLRQCNDFTTIALPSPEKYCSFIRSFRFYVSAISSLPIL